MVAESGFALGTLRRGIRRRVSDGDVVIELLWKIRDQYVTQFRGAVEALRAAHGAKLVVQPMLRDETGAPWRFGPLDLPYRQDVAILSGTTSTSLSLDFKTLLKFEPLSFAIRDDVARRVTISPFEWDGAELVVLSDAPERLVWGPLRDCFLEHLEVEANDTSESPLSVVHFLSDPQPHAGGFWFELDLGTASAEAAYDLLFAALDCGATSVQLR